MELNSNEVAALLGFAEEQVRDWAHTGKLPVVDLQGHLRFNRQAIIEWALLMGYRLNLGVTNISPASVPPVTELFAPERFHYDLPGQTFTQVLRAALDVFALPPEDKELIYDLLVSRERLMTTALGHGLAIPHVRVPLVIDAPRPALSIFFVEKPIDMGALDGQPVHTLFLLLTQTPNQHLELLARLTFLFRQPAFVDLLRQRAQPPTILEWIQKVAGSDLKPRR